MANEIIQKDNIMDAKIKAEYLDHAVTAAKSIQDDCILQLHEDKIELQVDDQANVAYSVITLNKAAFDEFQSTSGRVGLDLKKLSAALKHIDSQALTTVQLNESGTNLFLEGGGQKFNLKTILPDHVKCGNKLVELEYQARVAFPGEEFNHAIGAADDFSDYLIFYIQEDEGALKLRGEGDIHDTERTLGPDVLKEIEVGPAYNIYSLDYLSRLSTAISDDATVELELAKEERPMNIQFDIADGAGVVEYLLSPHIRAD